MTGGTHRRRQALGGALRSLLFPGWGQLHLGRRVFGWVLIVVSTISILSAVAIVAALGPTEMAARLTEPRVLVFVLVFNGAVALFRLIPVVHAWSIGGGRSVVIALVLAAVVLAPHVAVGYVGAETRRALDITFAASTTTTTTTTTMTTTTMSPTSEASSSPSTTAATTTTTTPTTTTVPDPEEERINVLLLGGDAGPGRSGLRTDSVIVASVDPVGGHASLFSLPRNWSGLALADGSVVPDRILNEVYDWARRRPERFPGVDPGAVALVEIAEVLTGLEIDYFALVDLTGFAAVVDAVGGVTIDVPRSVYGPSYDPATGRYTMIRIPRGEQRLDGAQALAYVRERYQSSDYDRMRRQRCVLAALVEEADIVSLLRGVRGILAAMENHVTTDLPREEVPVLIRTASSIETISVLGFDNRWRRGWTAEGFAIPDADRIREAVAETIAAPDTAESFGVREAGAAC